MRNKKIRNTIITVVVIIWSLIFHYESVRYFYLNPLFEKSLPKVKFLFPPAGWIMFFQVNNSFGNVDVYGLKEKTMQLIDAHDIFRTRTIGYDNVHRNVLSTVANTQYAESFCKYLKYRFEYFDNFYI